MCAGQARYSAIGGETPTLPDIFTTTSPAAQQRMHAVASTLDGGGLHVRRDSARDEQREVPRECLRGGLCRATSIACAQVDPEADVLEEEEEEHPALKRNSVQPRYSHLIPQDDTSQMLDDDDEDEYGQLQTFARQASRASLRGGSADTDGSDGLPEPPSITIDSEFEDMDTSVSGPGYGLSDASPRSRVVVCTANDAPTPSAVRGTELAPVLEDESAVGLSSDPRPLSPPVVCTDAADAVPDGCRLLDDAAPAGAAAGSADADSLLPDGDPDRWSPDVAQRGNPPTTQLLADTDDSATERDAAMSGAQPSRARLLPQPSCQ